MECAIATLLLDATSCSLWNVRPAVLGIEVHRHLHTSRRWRGHHIVMSRRCVSIGYDRGDGGLLPELHREFSSYTRMVPRISYLPLLLRIHQAIMLSSFPL